MLWPRLLMNAGTKAHVQLLLGQMGPLKKNPSPLLFINTFKKMNVKWQSIQQGLCIIIYLLPEIKNNETIFSFKAMLE